VADYSEFPTTPTAWQEQQLRDWETVTPLSTEDPPPSRPRRRVDLGALIPGVAFIVIAIVLMTGVDVSVTVFRNGGLVWVALIGGGIALLIRELRRARQRH
jgi:hypothetical protein